MESVKLYLGDCLEKMQDIPDKSIDAIITDPPYGTTACKWDSVIPFEAMWEQLNRIIKPNGAIVLFGSEPFSSALRMSNIKNYCYDWVWNKRFGANFAQAKRQPIKDCENVIIFSKTGKMPIYKPIKIKREKPITIGKNANTNGAIPLVTKREYDKKVYTDKNPTTITSLNFSCRGERGLHPTQKPVPLMEYLIKTYTNEGETVLDFTMGSGSTGVACINTNRNFIGIEQDEKYFKIAEQRIKDAYNDLKLF